MQHGVIDHGLGFVQLEFELIDMRLNLAAAIVVVGAELLLQSLHAFIGQIALTGIELLPQCAFFNRVFNIKTFALALHILWQRP